jgi:serine/threonine-protein kinase
LAWDVLLGREVAVKWGGGQVDAERWRREIAALRMLALPGMVALLDHGVWDGRPYLVMERVPGSPFPGRRGPVAWKDLADPAATLLETLAAVHEAGFVHRDIKPSNVLVDAQGRSVLLDFGLARSASSGDTMTTAGAVVGTPAYMAPEVLLGERPTAASDLYSFGCMLFEALAGQVPHRGSEAGFLTARLRRPAEPLPEGVAAPAEVRAWIEALLALDPGSRPGSARAVLRGLAAPEMAWLGPEPAWEPPGPGVYPFYSPPGGGKTSWARRLAGERAVWGSGEERPLSLARSLGIESKTSTLSEMQQALDAKLQALASSGRWLVLDGAEGLDERSWRAIRRTTGLICLFLTHKLEAGAPIPRLSPTDLAALFEGPDLLLHLPEDASLRLWRRSRGWPGLVVQELARWERAGLARRVGSRWRVTREDLDRLAGEGAGTGLPPLRGLDAAASEVLSILELAGELDADQLARATGRAPWEVEATLDDLAAAGGVVADGPTWIPRASAEASRTATVDDRAARHGASPTSCRPARLTGGATSRWRAGPMKRAARP